MPHRDLQGDGPLSCLDQNLVAFRLADWLQAEA